MTAPKIRTNSTMTKRTERTAHAECSTCGRAWTHPNALGPASIHARAHGHIVAGRIVVAVTYDGTEAGTDE